MQASGTPPLVFGGIVIDFAGRRVLRADQAQALEPKAFDVLVLLASAPGRAFSRDEILDAVWGHRHVTPGVLNRVMTLLRHALGEDAQSPCYLHTLHGMGYRFDLPVIATSEQSGSEATETGTGPRAALAATVPVIDPATDATPGAGSEPRRRRASDDRPRVFPRAALWLLPLLALLAYAGWKLWSREMPVAGGPRSDMPAKSARPATTPTLVVMPLKPIGDSESTRTIADGLSEELIGSVARIDGLRVIARESTRLAAAESDDPELLAQRLGITHVIEGSLQQAGQALRIHLRLVDAHGRTMWARDFDRDASEVLLMQREIAESVATSLTLKLGLATTPSMGGDAEFLRRFLAAQALLNSGNAGEQAFESAESEFRALLRERPDDARVHSGLASALNVRAIYNHSLPPSVRDDALQEAITAQRLDPSLADPYGIQAFVACQRNEWTPCVALMHEADVRGMKVYPIANPAIVLARLGYLDRAEAQAREQVARDPLNEAAHFMLGRVLDTRARHEEAKAELAASRNQVDNLNHYAHWFNAYWRKDYAEAGKLVEEGLGPNDTNWPKMTSSYVATMRALSGQGGWAEAETENRKFEQATGLFALLRVLQPDAHAHAPELIAGLERMRKGSYSTWDLVLWQKQFAFLRRDPMFQDYIRRNGILDYWRKHGFPKQCRAQGDGAYCE